MRISALTEKLHPPHSVDRLPVKPSEEVIHGFGQIVGEHLHRDMDYSVASGKLKMQLKGAPDELTEAILQTMLLGLMEIAKLSPEGVRIQEQRR